ncbi:MAG: DUF1643 domain-containing protein [Pseudomonadota bacterium]
MSERGMQGDAVISRCGRYRYRLRRWWSDGPTCLFIMLNPSTAGAERSDPTIRRCIGFAKREGCGALSVVNVMAFRATSPADLPEDTALARGPRNAAHIRRAIGDADGPIIAAWGAHPKAEQASDRVLRQVSRAGRRLFALGLTMGGAPGHPLYIRADAQLVPMNHRPAPLGRPQRCIDPLAPTSRYLAADQGCELGRQPLS